MRAGEAKRLRIDSDSICALSDGSRAVPTLVRQSLVFVRHICPLARSHFEKKWCSVRQHTKVVEHI
jgi:hypothetical protein